ncbi:MAG: four helix bundle protein [Phycisphaerales bacterium]
MAGFATSSSCAEDFSDRSLAVAERLQSDRRFNRFVEQLAASGTSVGANIAEASDAMSEKDFRKCLAIAKKELNETRFYFRLCVRREWIAPDQLDPLLTELEEIRAIVGSILHKTNPDRQKDE